jgi:8-oxo-dGTP diphosphatase
MNCYGEKKPNQTYIVRPGVYGITFDALNRVALVKVPYGYHLPGGGIDPGEDHEMCLKREFLEETGYDVSVESLIEISTQYTFSEKHKNYYALIGHFYVATMLDNRTAPQEPDHELVWHSVDEAVELLSLEYQAEALKTARLKVTANL